MRDFSILRAIGVGGHSPISLLPHYRGWEGPHPATSPAPLLGVGGDPRLLEKAPIAKQNRGKYLADGETITADRQPS